MRTLKVQSQVILLLLFVAMSCSKEDAKSVKPNENNGPLEQLQQYKNLNAEADRIVDDVQDPDWHFGITADAGWGTLDMSPESNDLLMSGKTPTNLELFIDGDKYTPARSDGTWFQGNSTFPGYYGKTVDIEIILGNDQFTFERYIPEPVLANKLSPNGSMTIDRTGNTLEWTPDPDNPSNKLGLYYNLYDSTSFSTAAYDGDVLIIDDDGSYNFDHLISDSKCKRISLSLVNGNTASFTVKGEKYLFDISTYDNHNYLID